MDFQKKNVKILMLYGKARSGKDTIAKIIKEKLDDKSIKTIILSYTFYLKEYVKNISDWSGSEEDKPRTLLQSIGTDLIKKIDSKFLINRLKQDIEFYSYFYDAIIITGARLKAEIDDIKNNYENVKIMKIIGKENDLSFSEKNHITELDLDDYTYDYLIDNTSEVDANKIYEIIGDYYE